MSYFSSIRFNVFDFPKLTDVLTGRRVEGVSMSPNGGSVTVSSVCPCTYALVGVITTLFAKETSFKPEVGSLILGLLSSREVSVIPLSVWRGYIDSVCYGGDVSFTESSSSAVEFDIRMNNSGTSSEKFTIRNEDMGDASKYLLNVKELDTRVCKLLNDTSEAYWAGTGYDYVRTLLDNSFKRTGNSPSCRDGEYECNTLRAYIVSYNLTISRFLWEGLSYRWYYSYVSGLSSLAVGIYYMYICRANDLLGLDQMSLVNEGLPIEVLGDVFDSMFFTAVMFNCNTLSRAY